MQFFKGYKDVKALICAQLEVTDLFALKRVNTDWRDYINKHHFDGHYKYILGNAIQIGRLKGSLMSYQFPTQAQILDSFPNNGKVVMFSKRGDAKEAVKTVNNIDAQDRVISRAIFLVKVSFPRVLHSTKIVSYKIKDPVNGTNDKLTMIINDIDAESLVPCRAMIIDDQNRIVKHSFINKKGEVEQRNFMELTLQQNVDLDTEFTKSKCVIS